VTDPLILIQLARHARTLLPGPPTCHHQQDSIDAHLTIVFAALAASRCI
jgi:hypothetical protein